MALLPAPYLARVYRNTGIAITRRGQTRPQAQMFADYLASPEGERIFARWGSTTTGGASPPAK